MKVSILIPVYRESTILKTLLRKFLSDKYKDKEILVGVDKPTKKTLRIIRKYKKVKFSVSKKRRGKVNTLNYLFRLSQGKVLLFVDSDTLPKGRNFLTKLVKEIEDTDLLDMKKDIILDSFLSKLVNYEYVILNLVSWFCGKFMNRTLFLNGSAFAVKRKVFEEVGGFKKSYAEDFELAKELFLKGKKYKYSKHLRVSTQAPSTLKEWLKQRKRWGNGLGIWIRNNKKILKKTFRSNLKLFFPFLLVIYPYFILFISFLSFNIYLLALSFFASTLTFFTLSKKFEFRFNPLDFLIYYYFYFPLSIIFLFLNTLKSLLSKEVIVEDWKI